MRGMAIREYAAGDRETCLLVFDTNVPRYFRPHEREEFGAFLDDLPGPYLVLVDDSDTIVGCGGYAVSEDTGSADLCWGMVRRGMHGRGLGRVLTERRIGRIKEDDRVRSIRLHTSQHTAAFYERLGFRVTRVVRNGYAPDLDRHEMVLELQR